LKQGLHVSESEHSEKVAQLGHADFPATADIDRAQQRDAGVDRCGYRAVRPAPED
jgi:hypothetical protein